MAVRRMGRSMVTLAMPGRGEAGAQPGRTDAARWVDWRRTLPAQPLSALALEPRMMFDGAAVDTATAVADTSPPPVADVPPPHDETVASDTPDTSDDLAPPAAGDPAAVSGRVEVAFVDAGTEDWQDLVAGMRPDVEVHVLHGVHDGLTQMLRVLEGRTGIDAIHILSHGTAGQVELGSGVLSLANLDSRAADLAHLGQALSVDGDILLYGCDVGEGDIGAVFTQRLASLTGADVDHPPVADVMAAPLRDDTTMFDMADDLAPPAAGDPAAVSGRVEVAFVDAGAEDWQDLVAGMRPDVEVHVLHGVRDGLTQMLRVLEGRTGIDAIHILSHGTAGQVELGSGVLSLANLDSRAADLAHLGQALSVDGDILLYGCDVGQSDIGAAFTGRLATLTQADVAASTDSTGIGGNWTLERTTGSIDTGLALTDASRSAYAHDLDGPSGTEFQVNTYTTNNQTSPSVAALSGGGFVVTWTSDGQDGSDRGVYGQRYDANGVALGAEFRVNTYTADTQEDPAVAALIDGGFVVTWLSAWQDGDNHGIYGQRYNANGTARGAEFRVNTDTVGSQWFYSVAALSGGGFVIAWESFQGGASSDTYGQRYDANGTALGTNFHVNTDAVDVEMDLSIAPLADGDFVLTWTYFGGQDGDGWGIYGQRCDANGAAMGTEFRVNTYTTGNQFSPEAAGLVGGGSVVIWMSDGTYGSSFGIHGQRYDANGAPLGAQFDVHTGPGVDSAFTSYGKVTVSSIAALPDGGFVATWGLDGSYGSNIGIYGQRYDANCVAVGAEFRINTYTTGNQAHPSVATLSDGGFVVAWQSASQDGSAGGIYGQRYDANGNPVAPGETAGATWSISPDSASVSENAGQVIFTLTRSSGATAETVYVSTTQTEGHANRSDYAGLFNQALVFGIGETEKTIAVSITNDSAVESSETFGLIVQRNTSDPITTYLAKGTFSIRNDDAVPNRAPSATDIPNQTAVVGNTFRYQMPANTFHDPDGDVLIYSATLANGSALPAWLSFNPATRTFSGTPTGTGTIGIRVTATDAGGLSTSDTFAIAINAAPTVANTIPDRTATAGTAFRYQVASNAFADQDASDTLAYSATLANGSALPAWLSFDAVTRTFSGTPTDIGTISVKVTARDTGGLSASDTFDISVGAAPVTSWSISPDSLSAPENAGQVGFMLTRSSGATAETVYVSTTQTESYGNSNDYTGILNQAVAFGIGETSRIVTVSITNDSAAEPNETFGLIVQRNATDPLSTYLAKGTFTIRNDDVAASPVTSPTTTPSWVPSQVRQADLTPNAIESIDLIKEVIGDVPFLVEIGKLAIDAIREIARQDMFIREISLVGNLRKSTTESLINTMSSEVGKFFLLDVGKSMATSVVKNHLYTFISGRYPGWDPYQIKLAVEVLDAVRGVFAGEGGGAVYSLLAESTSLVAQSFIETVVVAERVLPPKESLPPEWLKDPGIAFMYALKNGDYTAAATYWYKHTGDTLGELAGNLINKDAGAAKLFTDAIKKLSDKVEQVMEGKAEGSGKVFGPRAELAPADGLDASQQGPKEVAAATSGPQSFSEQIRSLASRQHQAESTLLAAIDGLVRRGGG